MEPDVLGQPDVPGGADVVAAIAGHPAWRAPEAGIELDALRGLSEFHSDDAAHVARLEALGVTIENGASKRRNRVFLADAPGKLKIKLNVTNARDCVAVFAPGSTARGNLGFAESGHLAVFGAGAGPAQNVMAQFRGRDCALVVGTHASAGSVTCLLEGPATCVVIGRGSMIGDGVRIHLTDQGGIVSLLTGEVVNQPADVVLEEGVWLGRDCVVNKGVRIGRGAIVGVRAVVEADVPAHCQVAGVPAAVVRRDVAWSRREAWRMLGKQWVLEGTELVEGPPPPPPEREPEPEPISAAVAELAAALVAIPADPPPAPPPASSEPIILGARLQQAPVPQPPVPGSRGWWRRR